MAGANLNCCDPAPEGWDQAGNRRLERRCDIKLLSQLRGDARLVTAYDPYGMECAAATRKHLVQVDCLFGRFRLSSILPMEQDGI